MTKDTAQIESKIENTLEDKRTEATNIMVYSGLFTVYVSALYVLSKMYVLKVEQLYTDEILANKDRITYLKNYIEEVNVVPRVQKWYSEQQALYPAQEPNLYYYSQNPLEIPALKECADMVNEINALQLIVSAADEVSARIAIASTVSMVSAFAAFASASVSLFYWTQLAGLSLYTCDSDGFDE